MKNLSVRWQKLIVWLTGYLNIIAFVIAGGYLYQKTEHEEVKSSAKIALIVTAIFTAIDILRLFIQYCLSLASSSSTWLGTASLIIAIIKNLVFVILFVLDMTIGFGNFTTGAKKTEAQPVETEKSEPTDAAE